MNGIKHIKSTPYYPAINGTVKRLVQKFKKAMKTSEHDCRTHSQRLSSFLLAYKSTPHTTTQTTPSELFLKRSLRTRLNLLKLYHDPSCHYHYYEVGQNVQAYNFRNGPHWVAEVVVKNIKFLDIFISS